MAIIDDVKDTFSKAVFSPSALMSGRGGLHMAQIILSLVTFILAAFYACLKCPYHLLSCVTLSTRLKW